MITSLRRPLSGVKNSDIFLAIFSAPGSLLGTAKDAIGLVDSKSMMATTFSLELMSIPTKRKVRKQGGLCTGITQNVVDLLQNYTATTMLANSEFVALLKQANTDSSKMAEVIGVSDAQLRFVTNSQSGMGLLKCGNVVIPFDNQIGKDTSLYKLYNTNIHEKIAEQKAKYKLDEV